MRILIAGGTGLLGPRLSAAWLASGAEVSVLSRQPDRGRQSLPPGVDVHRWAPPAVDAELVDTIRGADAVINLAGESLAGPPWTAGRKRALLESRLAATGALVEAIGRLPAADRPEVLVNASGIDVYGDRRDRECGEDTPAGDTALARIVVAWEAAAGQAEKSRVRVVLARTALVIAPEALAFRLLTLPVRLFVGGPLGSGDQPFTWVHVDDAVGLYQLAVADPTIRGPLNLVALEAPAQRQVARTIGRVLHRPSVFPTPEFLLRLVLRDAADLILHGRRAVPARAIAAGYRFRFPKLEPAVRDALGRAAD